MDDPNTSGGQPRPDAVSQDALVRVVLAEADAPGSIHYLLEAEGFQVVGCAADEGELRRVLEQDLHPDVIVLDTDIIATAVLVAREGSPSSHLIVIWPDGVQLPSAAERIAPSLVYEQLGPAIRRATDEDRLSQPIVLEPTEPPRTIADGTTRSADAPDPSLRRAASRISVTSVVLVAAIVLTMGASFALEGWQALDGMALPSRSAAPKPSLVQSEPRTSPSSAPQRPDAREPEPERCATAGRRDPKPANAHAASAAAHADDPTCRHPDVGGANAHAHPSGKDQGVGNPKAGGNGGNGGTTHGHGGGGSNGQSGEHGPPDEPGRPDEHPSMPGAGAHGPKN